MYDFVILQFIWGMHVCLCYYLEFLEVNVEFYIQNVLKYEFLVMAVGEPWLHLTKYRNFEWLFLKKHDFHYFGN